MKAVLKRALAWFVVCFLVLLTFSRVSVAASLDSIKDGKVLMNLDGNAVKSGDTFLVLDTQGKKRALITVSQVKGTRALAVITKGQLTKAPSNYVLQARGNKGSSGVASRAGGRNAPPSAWGVNAGYALNRMTVTEPSVSMSGSGLNFEGFYEREIDGAVQMLARLGYQSFKASGTSALPNCVGTVNCSVELSYLGFDGLVKYSFFGQKMTYWLAGGLGFSFPLSKSSNVIDVSKVSVSQKVLADVGLNYYLNRRAFIPVSFEYALFPNNSVVSSSQMILRVGYGQTF